MLGLGNQEIRIGNTRLNEERVFCVAPAKGLCIRFVFLYMLWGQGKRQKGQLGSVRELGFRKRLRRVLGF